MSTAVQKIRQKPTQKCKFLPSYSDNNTKGDSNNRYKRTPHALTNLSLTTFLTILKHNGTQLAFYDFKIGHTNQGFIKMDNNKKIFEVKKTFGLSVLLKLTRKTIDGIEISEMDGKYRSNLDFDKMNQAVTRTMASHNIQLKIG